jgi:glycosyltransferase involved in cell wall biosynthesis
MSAVAFVMEQTLGSVTHYLNLRHAEDTATAVKPLWVPVHYAPGRVPWALTGSLRARRAVDAELANVDGLFVHTTTIALLCASRFRTKPTVLSTDGTPANKREMRSLYGLDSQSRWAERAKRAVYRRVMREARAFVAWSNWARDSLIGDYGCPPADVAVIPPGVDLGRFAPGARDHAVPRILFVGGEFHRKGGDLLLDVFHKRLRGRAVLELVTQANVASEDGVTVHRGLAANSSALHELYARCDIFALPTRADCSPLVCMEAAAAGLPQVASRVGGIADLIEDGETGHLVRPGDPDELGDALESLVADDARRRRMGELARALAARRFDGRKNARSLFAFVAEHVGAKS